MSIRCIETYGTKAIAPYGKDRRNLWEKPLIPMEKIIFALKMYIFKLKMYIFSLNTYIFNLNIYLSRYSGHPCH